MKTFIEVAHLVGILATITAFLVADAIFRPRSGTLSAASLTEDDLSLTGITSHTY